MYAKNNDTNLKNIIQKTTDTPKNSSNINYKINN